MAFLYFLGALLTGTAVVLGFLRLLSPRRTEPQVAVELLATASGQMEMESWRAALRAAGIWTHIVNVGDLGWYGASPYAYEVWVREKDAKQARVVLGFS